MEVFLSGFVWTLAFLIVMSIYHPFVLLITTILMFWMVCKIMAARDRRQSRKYKAKAKVFKSPEPKFTYYYPQGATVPPTIDGSYEVFSNGRIESQRLITGPHQGS